MMLFLPVSFGTWSLAGTKTVDHGRIDAPAPDPSLSDFWTKAKFTGDLRLRYEYGDQEGRNTSHAGTFRTRVGILTGQFAGFQGFAEYEGTLAFDRDSYQAASVHGLGRNNTIIADPESHELNRAWVSWTGFDTTVKGGRQRIILDNSRFVGNVGWRQNEQTFDATTVKTKLGDFDLFYGYIWQTLRIFGSESPALDAHTDFDGSSHLANVAYNGLPNAKVVAYAYLLDLDNAAGTAKSSNSFGAFVDGKVPFDEGLALTYYGEYAYQTEGKDSPLDYGANYFHLKAGAAVKKVNFGVGFESLGSDNGVGFKFPLGTNHKFNGFADKFLSTPADGLQDLYVYAGAKLPKDIGVGFAYHWFGSDSGSLEYGQEVDFVITKKITERLGALGKFAYYAADDFATDTTRFSVELGYKF